MLPFPYNIAGYRTTFLPLKDNYIDLTDQRTCPVFRVEVIDDELSCFDGQWHHCCLTHQSWHGVRSLYEDNNVFGVWTDGRLVPRPAITQSTAMGQGQTHSVASRIYDQSYLSVIHFETAKVSCCNSNSKQTWLLQLCLPVPDSWWGWCGVCPT